MKVHVVSYGTYKEKMSIVKHTYGYRERVFSIILIMQLLIITTFETTTPVA